MSGLIRWLTVSIVCLAMRGVKRSLVGGSAVALVSVGAALAAQPRLHGGYVYRSRSCVVIVKSWHPRQLLFDISGYYNNENPQPVPIGKRGFFSYKGPAMHGDGQTATIHLKGRFVSTDEAKGRWRAPCGSGHFDAKYNPSIS
jgi:hypothetical protein